MFNLISAIKNYWSPIPKLEDSSMGRVFEIKNDVLKELEKKNIKLPPILWDVVDLSSLYKLKTCLADASVYLASGEFPETGYIRLSSSAMPFLKDEAIRQSVLHEIGHVIDKENSDHGEPWRRAVSFLGGKPEKYAIMARDLKVSERHRFPQYCYCRSCEKGTTFHVTPEYYSRQQS